MEPEFVAGNVRADCPDCGVSSTFEFRNPDGSGEFGTIIINGEHDYEGNRFSMGKRGKRGKRGKGSHLHMSFKRNVGFRPTLVADQRPAAISESQIHKDQTIYHYP